MTTGFLDPRIRRSLMASLEVKDLTTRFRTDDGIVRGGLRRSFPSTRARTLGMVGESGSASSVTF